MNYTIPQSSKLLIEKSLLEAAVLISAIPDSLLSAEMIATRDLTLHNLNRSGSVLNNLVTNWEDLEADVQK